MHQGSGVCRLLWSLFQIVVRRGVVKPRQTEAWLGSLAMFLKKVHCCNYSFKTGLCFLEAEPWPVASRPKRNEKPPSSLHNSLSQGGQIFLRRNLKSMDGWFFFARRLNYLLVELKKPPSHWLTGGFLPLFSSLFLRRRLPRGTT